MFKLKSISFGVLSALGWYLYATGGAWLLGTLAWLSFWSVDAALCSLVAVASVFLFRRCPERFTGLRVRLLKTSYQFGRYTELALNILKRSVTKGPNHSYGLLSLLIKVWAVPIRVVVALRRKVIAYWKYLRVNKVKSVGFLTLGVGAGIVYAYRLIKKESKTPQGALKLSIDRARYHPESNQKSDMPAVVDMLRRFILAGCAYVSILGALRGVLDNRIVRDIVVLFTSILRLYPREDKEHICTATNNCCALRNVSTSLLRNLTGCSCECHNTPMQSNGTPMNLGEAMSVHATNRAYYDANKDEIDATVEGINLKHEAAHEIVGAATEAVTAQKQFYTDSEKEEDDAGDAILNAASIAGDDDILQEDVGFLALVWRTGKRIATHVYKIVVGLVTGPELVLGIAFVIGFVCGAAALYYWPSIKNFTSRKSASVKLLKVKPLPIPAPPVSPLVLAAAVKAPAILVPTVTPKVEVKLESTSEEEIALESHNKPKNRRARVHQGGYDQVDVEQYFDKYDEDDDYVQGRLTAAEKEEERAQAREEQQRIEDQYGEELAYAMEDKRKYATWESKENNVVSDCNIPEWVEKDQDCLDLYTVKESRQAKVNLFAYECPLCSAGKHRLMSCPKNRDRKWMFVSKNAGYELRTPLGEDIKEVETGYIFNKEKIVANRKTGTITHINQQSLVVGVPIIDVENFDTLVLPLFNESHELIHSCVPLGNYLAGPLHGHPTTGRLYLEGPLDGEGNKTWIPLELAEKAPNVPAMEVSDDFVWYKKPNVQGIRSVQLGTLPQDKRDNQMIFLVGFMDGRLKMSGPRPMIRMQAGISDKSKYQIIVHECSSKTGFSGGAIVNADTGKIVGMHLGAMKLGSENYGIYLDHPEIVSFMKTTPKVDKKPKIPPPSPKKPATATISMDTTTASTSVSATDAPLN